MERRVTRPGIGSIGPAGPTGPAVGGAPIANNDQRGLCAAYPNKCLGCPEGTRCEHPALAPWLKQPGPALWPELGPLAAGTGWNWRSMTVAGVMALQGMAAVYLVIHAGGEFLAGEANGFVELIAAASLLGGILIGLHLIRRLVMEARNAELARAVASGALGELITDNFTQWDLTSAEADVALFALKGFETAEIARLRQSAASTVRVQLGKVYEKAGVSSRAEFQSLFLEDLMGEPVPPRVVH
jgi:DNA-binding CsgD family transcriptional regulator